MGITKSKKPMSPYPLFFITNVPNCVAEFRLFNRSNPVLFNIIDAIWFDNMIYSFAITRFFHIYRMPIPLKNQDKHKNAKGLKLVDEA